jgi:Na+/H+-dicarboxylate symporter
MVAGIPSGSLIALIIILETVGIDAKGLGLIMAAERFLDMGRTFVNVLTNSIICTIVHKKSL